MAMNFVIPTKMKAWMYREHGDVTNALRSDLEFEVPKGQEGQVQVKVLAVALNPVDTMRVNEVGLQVKELRIRDEVYGSTSQAKKYGTVAEYTVVKESFLVSKPKKLSFEEAASLQLVIQTAHGGLERGGLSPGKSLLVLGGAGGVGTQTDAGQSERAVETVKPGGSVVTIVGHAKALPPPAFSFLATSDFRV